MQPTELLLATPRLVDSAGVWFLDSGIQEASGGVARYYYSDRCANARVSTEITGYTLSALLYLNRVTEESRYLEAARRAGQFLLRDAWDPAAGLFPFELAQADGTPSPAYFFDCGIIVRALLRLWHQAGEARALEIAQICGESMERDFLTADGACHPILNLPDKSPQPYTPAWSRGPGCYHLKAGLAWLELAEATGDDRWREPFERLLRYSLASHDIFLPDPAGRRKTMDRLHSYSYFMEALLAVATEDDAAADALAVSIDRAAGYLREISPEFQRSDVPAQILRVRLFADLLGVVPLNTAAAAEEAKRAASHQIHEGPGDRAGGFWFGRDENGPLPFVNPVSTAFCLQALEMWRQYQARELTPHLADLI